MPDVVKKIAALLEHERPETQMAAAIVLGELEVKDAVAVGGLAKLAAGRSEALGLAAIQALERIASLKALPSLLDALEGPPPVFHAAARALASLGEAALPEIRSRMKGAPPALQARLSEVLAQVSGRKGLGALLEGFFGQDRESVVRNAVMFRHELKGADPKERRSLFAPVARFLEAKRTLASEEATIGALRILGYLEDERAVPVLVAFTTPTRPSDVRAEALIALRFALAGRREVPEVVRALLKLAEDKDHHVARTALDSLLNLSLPPSSFPVLSRIARGDPDDLALTAVGILGAAGDGAARFLVEVVVAAAPARAQRALDALGEREASLDAIFRALLETRDDDARARLAHLLGTRARRLAEPARDALAKAARARLAKGLKPAEPLLALLGQASPERLALVLRRAAEQRMAGKDADEARSLYAALLRTDHAGDEDRLALARLELKRSPMPLFPHARTSDPALVLLCDLARRGAPVAEAILADRSIEPERRFFVGFHLAELAEGEGREVGHDLLASLARGRGKLARQAKNKLGLTGYDD